MKFTFDDIEKRVTHKFLMNMNDAQQQRSVRRRIYRLAQKFTPNAVEIHLKPSERRFIQWAVGYGKTSEKTSAALKSVLEGIEKKLDKEKVLIENNQSNSLKD